MKLFLMLGLCLLSLIQSLGQDISFSALKDEAEKYYAEGSYARALEVYDKAAALKLSDADRKWVRFRQADCLWRSDAASQTSDPSKREKAERELNALIRDVPVKDQDDFWASVHESLGDLHFSRHLRNWGGAWNHYQLALTYWGKSTDITKARGRYLSILWRILEPSWADRHFNYGNYSVVPLEFAEGAIQIAVTDEDKARAYYMLALALQRTGHQQNSARLIHAFENALSFGKKNSWYDDALFQYASWTMSPGPLVYREDGTPTYEPDYRKALELFKKLITDYAKGESRYWENASQQIKNITEPQLSLAVGQVYLPQAMPQYSLHARNVADAQLTLYRIDLGGDVQFSGKSNAQDWMNTVNLSGKENVSNWNLTLNTNADYKPFGKEFDFEKSLPLGAYLLEAKGGGKSARELILVTDAALVIKTSGRQALVYACDSGTGGPLANAKITLWEGRHGNNQIQWKKSTATADNKGIAIFEFSSDGAQLYVAGTLGNRQALSFSHQGGHDHPGQGWKIYSFTDRPAYRPNETVQWKFYARVHNGSTYSTPAHQEVTYEITDPRGAKVQEGRVKLTQFGTAWGKLDVKPEMTLGAYQIHFWNGNRSIGYGSSPLFRLEEYKLPEFKVTVKTPEDGGKTKTFRLGERVEVVIEADYYFGGPVANAEVDVQVFQSPFHFHWQPEKPYDWLFGASEAPSHFGHYGRGQQIKSEKIKTGPDGRAILSFETPFQSGQDLEFRIEARVTDSSRREIRNSSSVRVTKQRFYVFAKPKQFVYRPKTPAQVTFHVTDANHQPVSEKGRVTVFRDYWKEIWLDPAQREIQGEALVAAKKQYNVFPPPVAPGRPGWQIKYRGYVHEEVLVTNLVSNADGKAELQFAPPSVGYYRAVWFSKLTNEPPVRGETTLWASTTQATELGYRPNGIQLIVDKESFTPGEKAGVLILAPEPERYVLLSVEGEDLYSTSLHQLGGTSQLVEIPLDEKHVPNVFVSAHMVSFRESFTDQKEIIVAPVKNLLNLTLKSDRTAYRPRDEATLTLEARDHQGKPIAGEFALSVMDESVLYIQSEYAGDPRQFYYGQKRGQTIQTQSSFQYRPYWIPPVQDSQGLAGGVVGRKSRADRFREESKGGYALGERDIAFASAAPGAPAPESAAMRFPASGRLFKSTSFDNVSRSANKKELADLAAEETPIEARTDFRSTLLWLPDLITGADGRAEQTIKISDDLTTWRAVVRGASTGNQFGHGSHSFKTRKPLITRLQAPRFFTAGDQVVVSSVVNNNTDSSLTVVVSLDAEGLPPVENKSRTVTIPANRDQRVDWTLSPKAAGPIKLKTSARSGTGNQALTDAMEKTYFVVEHGIEKFLSKSGKTRSDSVTVRLNIPKERKDETTVLTVQVTPSLAVTMLDALPYLIDYPYGCVEQTMSRFLPAVITSRTLKGLGLTEEDVATKIFGGIEPGTTNVTATYKQAQLAKISQITTSGISRLEDFQHSDGGWGWWKEGDSDPFMTAYVYWGFALAEEAGLSVKSEVLNRAQSFLQKKLVEAETQADLQAWMLHALSVRASLQNRKPHAFESKALNNTYAQREQLNAYTRALLALSAHGFGEAAKARVLIQNLENGVKKDERPDQSIVLGNATPGTPEIMATAHWGEDGVYWRWSDGGVEATAFALKALVTIDPQNKLIEPVMNWLVKNRRGAQWSNTRDTAIVVLAMNDYLKASKELETEVEYEIKVNGSVIAQKKLTRAELLSAPSRYHVPLKTIRSGDNDIRIVRKKGGAPLYFAAEVKFFSLEEPITAAGNEIFVRRDYYIVRSTPTLLKGYQPKKQKLVEGETIQSGDRIETVLTIEAKNNYEYLVFEDSKAAGMEAGEIQSGGWLMARELRSDALPIGSPASGSAATAKGARRSGPEVASLPNPDPEMNLYTNRQRGVYPEWRDRKSCLFIDKLPQGVWQIKYEYRAEIPGQFHALPVIGHAMYVPEIRCNGAEHRIRIVDATTPVTQR